jgi:hypothetical protein
MPRFDGSASGRYPKRRRSDLDGNGRRIYVVRALFTLERYSNALFLLNLARGVATSVERPWEQIQTPQIM